MQPDLDQLLTRVAEDTFSAMTFLLPEEAPTEASGPWRQAAVEFAGPFSGRLTLRVADAMVPELAVNMLGLESGPATPVQERDTLAELANVICGNLLPLVATPQDVFNVGAPRVTPPEAPLDPPSEPPAASAQLSFLEGCVQLEFHRSAAPAQATAEPAVTGARP